MNHPEALCDLHCVVRSTKARVLSNSLQEKKLSVLCASVGDQSKPPSYIINRFAPISSPAAPSLTGRAGVGLFIFYSEGAFCHEVILSLFWSSDGFIIQNIWE